MKKIEVVYENNANIFKQRIQTLLNENYKILSSNCGILQYPDNYSDLVYQAILQKED